MRVGREVLVAKAARRQPQRRLSDESVEFEFDARNGAMLRRASFENGRCVQLMEVLAGGFDREIDPERFAFAAPHALI
jgi:hypothetical protein